MVVKNNDLMESLSPIRELRENLGLNKNQLAGLLNISLPTLSLYEAGVTKNLSRIESPLKENKFNFDELEAKYKEYRKSKLNNIKILVQNSSL